MALTHNFSVQYDRRHTDSQMYSLYPEDVLPMHLAETNFQTAQPIMDALASRVNQGMFGYVAESAELGLAVQHWMASRFELPIEPEWAQYSPSVGSSLVFAVQAFTQPGDRVLIQTPVYHAFHSLIDNSGRMKAENKLILRNGRYEIDFEDLERQLSNPRTKLMLLCNPHNPVGRCWTKEELTRMAELCLRHHVFVVSDEVHADLVYEAFTHIPLPAISEEIAQHCMVTVNPSKTFNLAGMRSSAAIIPNERRREAFRVALINNKAIDRPVFGMVALEAAYRHGGYYVDQLVPYIEENAKLVGEFLREHIPQLELIQPEATYLLWLDARKLGLPPDQLAPYFLREAKVAFRDGASCGNGEGFLRMSIGFPRAVLEQALHQMKQAVSKLDLN
ncbi:MalY/PatB family protein [Paenibacillus luteus]|uniref:MalY/PatB family protein n=1 Tax=Paenibacillus luteus TaxID=2545753 RepID=UPI0019D508D5|nr:MalY/PatB family protein [Paenibacillus luteus]